MSPTQWAAGLPAGPFRFETGPAGLATAEPAAPRMSRLTKGTVMSSPKAHLKPHLKQLLRSEEGAATAEYAIATLAAVGFAGLLVVILRSDEVRALLTDLVRRALSIPG